MLTSVPLLPGLWQTGHQPEPSKWSKCRPRAARAGERAAGARAGAPRSKVVWAVKHRETMGKTMGSRHENWEFDFVTTWIMDLGWVTWGKGYNGSFRLGTWVFFFSAWPRECGKLESLPNQSVLFVFFPSTSGCLWILVVLHRQMSQHLAPRWYLRRAGEWTCISPFIR